MCLLHRFVKHWINILLIIVNIRVRSGSLFSRIFHRLNSNPWKLVRFEKIWIIPTGFLVDQTFLFFLFLCFACKDFCFMDDCQRVGHERGEKLLTGYSWIKTYERGEIHWYRDVCRFLSYQRLQKRCETFWNSIN